MKLVSDLLIKIKAIVAVEHRASFEVDGLIRTKELKCRLQNCGLRSKHVTRELTYRKLCRIETAQNIKNITLFGSVENGSSSPDTSVVAALRRAFGRTPSFSIPIRSSAKEVACRNCSLFPASTLLPVH
jgi:hypothetical protein